MIGDLGARDASELAAWVAKGEVSADELLDAALAAVAARNPALNAVVLVDEAAARRAIAQGLPQGPFRGVPFLIKDMGLEARDFPSHGGSRLLHGMTFADDCAMMARMRATGLVTFGRTTSPEGAIGIATEAAVYGGPTRNPWSLDHTPGGSSGGAAAAVAAGIVALAHGSDGGGSVRVPASNCGLFGFKATRARLPDGPWSGEGWAGMAIDGFLTRSVRDNAAMLDACAGPDLGAPYMAPPMAQGYLASLGLAPRPLRIALCDTTFMGEAIHPEVAEAVRATARLLADMGHQVEIARPRADVPGMMRAWTDIVAVGTASWVRGALQGRALSPDLVEGVARGAVHHAERLTPMRYLEAVEEIHAFGREMAAFFTPEAGRGFDILLSATIAEPPARIGRFSHATEDYLAFRTGPEGAFRYSPFAAIFNASGQPAASLPLAMSADGLPIGIHLAAAFGQDATLINLCAQLEQAAPWAHRRAPMAG